MVAEVLLGWLGVFCIQNKPFFCTQDLFSNYLVCLKVPICFPVHINASFLKVDGVLFVCLLVGLFGFLKIVNRRQLPGFQIRGFTRTFTSPAWTITPAYVNPLTINPLGCDIFLDECFTVISILFYKYNIYKGGPVSVCAKGNFVVPSI